MYINYDILHDNGVIKIKLIHDLFFLQEQQTAVEPVVVVEEAVVKELVAVVQMAKSRMSHPQLKSWTQN